MAIAKCGSPGSCADRRAHWQNVFWKHCTGSVDRDFKTSAESYGASNHCYASRLQNPGVPATLGSVVARSGTHGTTGVRFVARFLSRKTGITRLNSPGQQLEKRAE